jgi:hypothetical protein
VFFVILLPLEEVADIQQTVYIFIRMMRKFVRIAALLRLEEVVDMHQTVYMYMEYNTIKCLKKI